ncbi:MAG: LEA type 2 family protein [Ectothiorhodospiraceae bacterium]
MEGISWRRVGSVVVVLVSLLAAGCAAMRPKVESPRVSLSSVRLIEAGLLEQRFELGLRVQNPNDFSLNIAGMDYELKLNGERFATGVASERVSVPASGEAVVQVPVTTSLLDNLDRLRRWQSRPPQSLDYDLSGRVKLSDFGFRVPFEYTGSVALTVGQ